MQEKVLILNPQYVAGKLGVICGKDGERWLVKVDALDIIVSLKTEEFKQFDPELE
ncbi:hypothetical protein CAL7716_107030 (plasmid) [Calothrix sp. PCC 7716]|nr:hypothetical protein CAL7716_107030 [Calothrix sp. PCC 7716]